MRNNLSNQSIFTGALLNISSKVVSRLLRFVLVIVISIKFGAGAESDAYFIAQSICLFFLFMGDNVFNYTFLPVFVDIKKNKSEKEAFNVSNTIFTLVTILSLVVSALIYVFAPQISSIMAPGFLPETKLLTSDLIRIISLVPLFAGVSVIPASIYFSFRSFLLPSITAVFYGLFAVIATILISAYIGIYSVVVGSVIGIGLQALFLIYFLKKSKHQFNFCLNVSSGVIKIIKLTGPRLVVVILGTMILMIDRFFASGLGIGYVSCLTYALRVFQMPSGILLTALGRTFMPIISEYGSSTNRNNHTKLFSKSLRLIIFFIVPLTAMLFICSTPIIKVLFQRGEFTETSTYLTTTVFNYYNIGLVFFFINVFLMALFYGFQDAVTPMKIVIVNFILNIILDALLIKIMGLKGIALATSIISFLNTIILMIILRNKINKLGGASIFKSTIKIIAATGIMSIVVYYIDSVIELDEMLNDNFMSILILFIVGLITYIILCKLIRVEEIDMIIKWFKLKLNKRWKR